MSVQTVLETAEVAVFGIRHHGPGSAKAVVEALEEFRPDAILIEGPADADPLVPWVADAGMEPPVALLAYAVGEPSRAAFWPFAVFSPEWQAMRWAVRHDVPVRFCDLPSGAVLAEGSAKEAPKRDRGGVRTDPIAVLADAAGYDDPERWWEDLVEHREREANPFLTLTDAMRAVRESAPPQPASDQLTEDRREAQMRQVLRQVLRSGAQRVAVVCGAWHAPALALASTGKLPPASRDAATLKGLPKLKSAVTWVPWSHSRLAYASGYGAGITSPGWYHHLFTATDRPVTRWFTRVADQLRQADLPVSSAHVIEAVRLAETLATLRGRPLAGLAEVSESTLAVMCEGSEVALRLVTDRLVVGESLGAVPDGAPTAPLMADLIATARRLRLKQAATAKDLDLDLRRAFDLERSHLLHRLRVLGIDWGTTRVSDVRATGTFRESWSLRWQPELAVAVVEASLWGTTVPEAAAARLVDRVSGSANATLGAVTAAVEQCLLADLGDALPELLRVLDARAAADLDVLHLMDALPALVRALRYGDVRGTETGALLRVADALFVRIVAALPVAVNGLDDDAALELQRHLDAVHEAVALRSAIAGTATGEGQSTVWLDLLGELVDRETGTNGLPGLLAGRFVRLLLDAGRLDPDDAARRLHRALSLGVVPAAKGAWVEGFLGQGGGLLLAHDPALIGLLDEWIGELSDEDFTAVLPLLRRTFSTFETGERRMIGEQVKRGFAPATRTGRTGTDWDVDEARALPAVRTVTRFLAQR